MDSNDRGSVDSAKPEGTSREEALLSWDDTAVTSSNATEDLRRTRFDDRARTRVSSSLSTHLSRRTNYLSGSEIGFQETNDFSEHIMQWNEMKTLTGVINSESFSRVYGLVIKIESARDFFLVATDKNLIIGFDSNQQVQFFLSANGESGNSLMAELPVTSFALSADSTWVATGFINGVIMVWKIPSGVTSMNQALKPSWVIDLKPKKEYAGTRESTNGFSVMSIDILEAEPLHLVSTDIEGRITYHYGFKRFTGRFIKSLCVHDRHPMNNGSLPMYYPRRVEMLPKGSVGLLTDYLCVLALLTGKKLLLVSILSLNNLGTLNQIKHFETNIPRAYENVAINSTSLSWFPQTESSRLIINPRLAYSWNGFLGIIELDNSSLPVNLLDIIERLNNKDKGIPPLPFKKTATWKSSKETDNILSLYWVNESILLAFIVNDSESSRILRAFYYESSDIHARVVPVGTEDMTRFSLSPKFTFSPKALLGHSHKKLNSLENLLKMANQNALLLECKNNIQRLFWGNVEKWTFRLVSLMDMQRYEDALYTATGFLNSRNKGLNKLLSLPERKRDRYQYLTPYLLRIIENSLLKGSKLSYEVNIKTSTYIDIIVALFSEQGGRSVEFANALEMVFDHRKEKANFFDSLEVYILSGYVPVLTPSVLRTMVEHYVVHGQGELLTELLCILDIRSLDIDLTINLSIHYRLRDCLIYIWNYFFDDYLTPLVDLLKDMRDERMETVDDNLRAYTYISYILTGRQYPTDRLIENDKSMEIKDSICSLIFSFSSLTLPADTVQLNLNCNETIFPYLFFLLRYNLFEMFSTINEFFEDSYLNEDNDKPLTRQYVVEALLDVFKVNKSILGPNEVNLAIFIARNFPKYPQYIRLSESVLNNVVETLCSNTEENLRYDCNLALLTLLPFHEPENETRLFAQLKAAKYYHVLLQSYKRKKMFVEYLDTWVSNREEISDEEYELTPLSTILEQAVNVGNIGDRVVFLDYLRNNLNELAILNVVHLVTFLSDRFPDIHSQALNLQSDSIFFQYALVFFDKGNFRCVDRLPLIVSRFFKLLFKYHHPEYREYFRNLSCYLIRDRNEWNQVLEFLKSNKYLGDLVELLLLDKQFYEAFYQCIEHLKFLAEQMTSEPLVPEMQFKFRNHLEQAMTICNLVETHTEYNEKEGLFLDEKMWVELIEACISFAHWATSFPSKDVHKGFFDSCIHDCFKRVSQASIGFPQKEKSMPVVFNKFLENSRNASKAVLLHVRDVLLEVFLSYSYENEILKYILKMLNSDVLQQVNLLTEEKVKGWNIKQRLCSICQKPLWGSDLSEDNFKAWQDRQLEALYIIPGTNITLVSKSFENEKSYNACSLIYFRCQHGYHVSCLDKLGGYRRKVCIICSA